VGTVDHRPDQSNASAAFNSAGNDSCSRCQTPAACQSRSRRRQVTPDPYPGRNWQSVWQCRRRANDPAQLYADRSLRSDPSPRHPGTDEIERLAEIVL
jgi:hypothetical protein